jgi:Prp8 binding protein
VRCFTTKYPLTSTEFSLNGDKIYAGGIDNDIKVFNLGQAKQEETIHGHQDTVSGLEISFDGTYLMSFSFD